jgi:hypothetical protein
MAEPVMKVFRINDCDWWFGSSLEQAIAAYMAETGLPFDEAVDSPRELTPEELAKHTYCDDDGTTHSFAEEVERMLSEGKANCLFASTEC